MLLEEGSGSSSCDGPPLAAAAVRDAPATPSRVRLRHPMECMPFRPAAAPKWRPRRSVQAPEWQWQDWTPPRIRSAADLGAVRVNFVYKAFQSMTAARSEKARRDQYFEGPHETAGFRRHDVDPRVVDVQYQPIAGEWQDAAGAWHRLTLDFAIETTDGRIVFGEDKASDEYFDDPETGRRLDHVERRLVELGASLQRRVAGGYDSDAERRAVKDVFDARRTEFDDADARRALAVVDAAGGAAPFGRVVESLRTHDARARDMVFAMVARRLLSIPFTAPPMPDTPVARAPRARKAGALRAFLASHVAPPAEDGMA